MAATAAQPQVGAATAMASNAQGNAAGPGRPDRMSPARDPCKDPEGLFDLEGRLRSRNGRHPGDDDRSQASRDDDDQAEDLEEDPPTDGRQLLGWAARQTPDAKGKVIGYGKKRGFPPRVLDWSPQQVAMAFHAARALTLAGASR